MLRLQEDEGHQVEQEVEGMIKCKHDFFLHQGCSRSQDALPRLRAPERASRSALHLRPRGGGAVVRHGGGGEKELREEKNDGKNTTTKSSSPHCDNFLIKFFRHLGYPPPSTDPKSNYPTCFPSIPTSCFSHNHMFPLALAYTQIYPVRESTIATSHIPK